MQKPAHHLEDELTRHIAEFDAATRGAFKPDPERGALLLAALDLGDEFVLCPCRNARAA